MPSISSSTTLQAQLLDELSRWELAGRSRALHLPAGLDFTTNDYLGLSNHPTIVESARRALLQWGAGSPASRLLRGHLEIHDRAEKAMAEWLDAQAALLFPSGWQANQAALTALASSEDIVFSDELNHASLIDGCRLTKAVTRIFSHNDPSDLRSLLTKAGPARRRFIVVESAYSMEGDRAPLETFAELAHEFDAYLIVDEAHAIGVYGSSGSGGCQDIDFGDRLAARIVTGGKALGVCGGFVAGSRPLIDLLLHRGRSFVFTTATSPATAAALTAAIRLARAGDERRSRLFERTQQLRHLLAAAHLKILGSGPIIPVLLGSEIRALEVASAISRLGFDVRAIRPPTVPPGTSRIRIVCHADHTPESIETLGRAVIEACRGESPSSGASLQGLPPLPRILTVAGTDTEIGKTVVSALLVRAAQKAGQPVRYLKPIQTGTDLDTETVCRLAEIDSAHSPKPIVELPLPASIDQAARSANTRVEVESVARQTTNLIQKVPEALWILECAGGLLVPINESEDQSHLLLSLQTPVILVARSGLGTLNHSFLSIEALQHRGLDLRALILVGDAHPGNVHSLQTRFPDLPILELPRWPEVSPQALDRWLTDHPLEFLLP